jgi:hypothetical protein
VQKVCFKCQKEKPLDEFYKHPQMADGRVNKCKECNKADVGKNYRDHFEQYREYERRWEKSESRKKAKLEYMRKHRATHPDRYQARNTVNNALRDGRLKKLPCRCGSLKVQAHHSDYSKPLQVDWLCFECHRQFEHGQLDHLERIKDAS